MYQCKSLTLPESVLEIVDPVRLLAIFPGEGTHREFTPALVGSQGHRGRLLLLTGTQIFAYSYRQKLRTKTVIL